VQAATISKSSPIARDRYPPTARTRSVRNRPNAPEIIVSMFPAPMPPCRLRSTEVLSITWILRCFSVGKRTRWSWPPRSRAVLKRMIRRRRNRCYLDGTMIRAPAPRVRLHGKASESIQVIDTSVLLNRQEAWRRKHVTIISGALALFRTDLVRAAGAVPVARNGCERF